VGIVHVFFCVWKILLGVCDVWSRIGEIYFLFKVYVYVFYIDFSNEKEIRGVFCRIISLTDRVTLQWNLTVRIQFVSITLAVGHKDDA